MATRQERKAAAAELRAARAELERVSRRDREETEDYFRANARVVEAEKHVPWWHWAAWA
jgi:hypothetical protein